MVVAAATTFPLVTTDATSNKAAAHAAPFSCDLCHAPLCSPQPDRSYEQPEVCLLYFGKQRAPQLMAKDVPTDAVPLLAARCSLNSGYIKSQGETNIKNPFSLS